jgi:hypothetical protein
LRRNGNIDILNIQADFSRAKPNANLRLINKSFDKVTNWENTTNYTASLGHQTADLQNTAVNRMQRLPDKAVIQSVGFSQSTVIQSSCYKNKASPATMSSF